MDIRCTVLHINKYMCLCYNMYCTFLNDDTMYRSYVCLKNMSILLCITIFQFGCSLLHITSTQRGAPGGKVKLSILLEKNVGLSDDQFKILYVSIYFNDHYLSFPV